MPHVTPAADTRPLDADTRLAELRQAFEDHWSAGNPLRLEEILQAADVKLRPALFADLLAIEERHRACSKAPLTIEEANRRFAALGQWAQDAIQRLLNSTGTWSRASRESKASNPKQRVFLGKYEILSRLGSGGHGTVLKVRHPDLKRLCAMKIVQPPRLVTPESAARYRQAVVRFQRERIALAKLSHPNIIQALDGGEAGELVFLVMEYVEGADLSRVSRSLDRFTVPDACELIRQSAEGLAYLERQKMIHRDIKPSNLFLGRDGIVRILDLGLVRMAEHEEGSYATASGVLMGTPDFIAPEQARGVRDLDIRADIYSLGCTFYSLLCGSAPFASSEYPSDYRKLNAHNEAPIPPIPDHRTDVPEGLKDLLFGMLQKRPQDRPSSPAALAAALVPYCEGHNLPRLIPPLAADEPVDRSNLGFDPVLFGPTRSEDFHATLDANRWRFGRQAWITSAVMILAVVGIVAALINRNRGPDTSEIEKQQDGPRLFIPGEWHEMLDREPKIVAWPDSAGNSDWKLEEGSLRANVRGTGMFELGRVEETLAGYELELTMTQNPWAGGVGLFCRNRRNPPSPVDWSDFALLERFQPQLRPDQARIVSGVMRVTPATKKASTDFDRFAIVTRPKLEKHRISAVVNAAGLKEVRFDDELANFAADPGMPARERDGIAGSFGIVVSSSSVQCLSFRFKPLKSGVNP